MADETSTPSALANGGSTAPSSDGRRGRARVDARTASVEPPGEARFQRISKLGAGGMGSVYHAIDRWRGTRVALKAVGRCEGAALARFKREFRALCDVDHPNLVRLGELFEEGGEWFFTMELVEGCDFLEYVRGPRKRPSAADLDATALGTPKSSADTLDGRVPAGAPRVSHPAPGRLSSHPAAGPDLGFDEGRLRASLAQLVQAVAALHELDKVHRDIKPGNVLVTPEGRVVLIDFGLITELRDGKQATDVGFAGTAAYMAPEQAEARAVDVRCDWYAVGVMLFEALTGSLPFEGSPLTVLMNKVAADPVRPSLRCPGVPRDLDDLCHALMARDPNARPPEREIFRRLFIESRDDAHPASTLTRRSAVRVDFVGRESELAWLGERAAEVTRGEAAAVLLTGESGIGKSALVDRLARTLERGDSDWLVLRGRAAPRESVPFHALDQVVDALAAHLAKLPSTVVEAWAPEGISWLVRTFPVLRRIDAFGRAGSVEIGSSHEQRARVFGALRDLLRSVGRYRPLLLVVDDLQWIDADSAALLAELVRAPDAPRMLLLATARTSTSVTEFEPPPALGSVAFGVLRLGPLSAADCAELCEDLVGPAVLDAPRRDALVRASAGHPLFLTEMLIESALGGTDVEGDASVERTIGRRLDRISPHSLDILTVLSVAGHPLSLAALVEVTGLGADEVDRLLARMRIERLLRHATAHPTSAYEPYHGQIRDVAASSLDAAAQRAMHGRIARVFEAAGLGTPEELAHHFEQAGDRVSAGRFAKVAADRAAAALAFDHAAKLYAQALAWEATLGRDRLDLRVAHAEALANAGRGSEAADAFLAASERSVSIAAVDLRRRAGEQLMLSGHFDRGIALFRQLLGQVGERYVASAWATLLSYAWLLLVRAFQGASFVERHESALMPEQRLRHDVVASMAVGLLPVDSLRGARFVTRAHVLALRLGEPGRVARALTYSIGNAVVSSPSGWSKARLILHDAAALAERSEDSGARALVIYSGGLLETLVGRWNHALAPLLESDRAFREECRTPPAEFRTVQTLIPFVYLELGRLRDFRARASRALREAGELGDLMIHVNVHCMAGQYVGCMDDAADAAHEAATAAMARWPLRGSNQDASFMEGSVACALYAGRPEEALRIVDASWPVLRSALVFFVHLMRVRAYRTRSLVLLHVAASDPRQAEAALRRVRADIRSLRREGSEWSRAIADQMEGGSLALRGERMAAAERFARAGAAFAMLDMMGYHHACMRRYGELLGAAGTASVAACDAYLRQEGVRVPENFVNVLAAPIHG